MKAIIRRVVFLAALLAGMIPVGAESAQRLSIAVLVTRDVEGEAVVDAMKATLQRESKEVGRIVRSFAAGEVDLHVVRCGAGLVNAVITTQMMTDRFQPALLVSLGLCAGLNEYIKVGDLIVADSFDRHDVGSFTDAGFIHGTAQNRKTRVESASLLSMPDLWRAWMLESPQEEMPAYTLACLVSGDSFIRGDCRRSWLIHKLGADAVDMSGAAMAATAEDNGIPLLVIRQVSDLGDQNAGRGFIAAASKDASELGNLAAKLIERWRNLSEKGDR